MTIKENLNCVLGSSLVIATLCTIITLIVVLCLYKLGKIQQNGDTMIKIIILIVFVFGTSWFIADTVVNWKKLQDHEDINVNKFLENAKESELEKNVIDDSKPNKIEIDNILKEPVTHAPEYHYIAKNKIQIPDEIDVYLDRGSF